METLATRILVVDDDKDVLRAAQLCLRHVARKVDILTDPELIIPTLQTGSYDAILLDMNFTRDTTSGMEGFEWLNRILRFDPDAVVILITAYGDIETAVRAIKAGATDFVTKPWQNEKLVATVTSGTRLCQARRHVRILQTSQEQLKSDLDQPFRSFVGESARMREVSRVVDKVAITDANVLILGENGTGKELIARAVHRQSLRREAVFCRVDLGAIAASLFESELFGHTKGAFTDAHQDRAGRFEIASGGTLFLDEISSLPLPLQPKLLTAIQEHQVTRVGSNLAIDVDVRLISASNLPLDTLVEQGHLRADLLYRINTVTIELPPLRERGDDVELLARHFLSVHGRKYHKPTVRLSATAISKLRSYRWPGNVRELDHAVERAVILCEGDLLTPNDFVLTAPAPSKNRLGLDSLELEAVEKTVIMAALDSCGGNVTRAAETLGITRTSLYRRMQKHGL